MKTNPGNVKGKHNSSCSLISLIKTQMFDQCREEMWLLVTNILNMAVPWAEAHILGNLQWAPVWNTYGVKQLEQVKIQKMGKRGGPGVVCKFLRKLRQRHSTHLNSVKGYYCLILQTRKLAQGE